MEHTGLNKAQLAERCGFTRVTLDNILSGADVKVSTIESLAKTLGVSVSVLFEDDNHLDPRDCEIEKYQKEISRLKKLLSEQKRSTRVVVELDVDDDEFIKMGLKDKIIQVLNVK